MTQTPSRTQGTASPAEASSSLPDVPDQPGQRNNLQVTFALGHLPQGPPRLHAVPPVALAAYQRAEGLIRVATPGCGLSWTVLAAIGYVTSNHGRNTAARTPANDLNGHPISDTDGGVLDHDQQHDRPIGPMAITPTAWTVIAVDADNDGTRDPNDIDDAALAVAVLLCSGTGRLTDRQGTADAMALLNADATFVRDALAAVAYFRAAATATPPPVPPSIIPAGEPHSVETSTAAAEVAHAQQLLKSVRIIARWVPAPASSAPSTSETEVTPLPCPTTPQPPDESATFPPPGMTPTPTSPPCTTTGASTSTSPAATPHGQPQTSR